MGVDKELENLTAMYEGGLLSPEEFAAAKTYVLATYSQRNPPTAKIDPPGLPSGGTPQTVAKHRGSADGLSGCGPGKATRKRPWRTSDKVLASFITISLILGLAVLGRTWHQQEDTKLADLQAAVAVAEEVAASITAMDITTPSPDEAPEPVSSDEEVPEPVSSEGEEDCEGSRDSRLEYLEGRRGSDTPPEFEEFVSVFDSYESCTDWRFESQRFDDASQDVELGSPSTKGAGTTVPVTITNHTDETMEYDVWVAAIDSDGETLATAPAAGQRDLSGKDPFSLGPGESREDEAWFWDEFPSDVRFEIDEANREP